MAAAVFAAVLAVYAITLAPTVTFWDAGEFIAAARTLGIPHPPGTPLFVLIAHAWGLLVPLGEYAVRTNLLSAIFSAAGAALFFLVMRESGGVAAAVLAALLGAFTFTNWQNSNETEVYAVATFTIAAVSWLALVWRRRRDQERAGRFLLLVVYLAGVSIGNHLLALLAGPGIVAFLAVTLWRDPAREVRRRQEEWGQVAVVAGTWALLIGTGLGSRELIMLGGLCFMAAAAYASAGGAGRFALAALAIAAVGVTPYLFMYLRAAQHPMINEADPASFDALLAVIRRAQYPPRTPLDDPTVPHGPGNPGRTLQLFGWQLLNYFQYFDWQWARSLADGARTVVTVLFVGLGLRGLRAQWRADRAAAWLLLGLFLVTGLGLVVYMNFRPGYSLGYADSLWPRTEDHEVRERDYFFVVSFIVWGLWAGLGAGDLAGRLLRAGRRWQPAMLLLALVPLGLNWTSASRRHGPDATLAADFAYDLLNSAPPYGVLFTYGDNDTFPLWWAQEVQGVRQDVTVICLALANTDWYMRQLRDQPTRTVDRAALPAVWRDSLAVQSRPDWPLHRLTDSMVAEAMNGVMVRDSQRVALGPLTRVLEPGFLYPNELLALSVIQQNIGRRPIVWSITAGRGYAGLGGHVIQGGLGFSLATTAPDSADARLDFRRLASAPLDIPLTERLVFHTYRYARLLDAGALELEPTAKSVAGSLALPTVQLAYAYQARNDRAAMARAVRYAEALSPNPDLRAALLSLLQEPSE
jgi:hypothetical protein